MIRVRSRSRDGKKTVQISASTRSMDRRGREREREDRVRPLTSTSRAGGGGIGPRASSASRTNRGSFPRPGTRERVPSQWDTTFLAPILSTTASTYASFSSHATSLPVGADHHNWLAGSAYYSGSGLMDLDNYNYSRPSTAEFAGSSSSSRPNSASEELHRFMLGEGPPIPRREWEHTGLGSVLRSRKNEGSVIGSGIRFTLMTYNVLAPSLMEKHPELYKSCDPSCLEWDKRVNRLMEEIQQFEPDILCLQEVEAAAYEWTFQPRLEAAGYRGVFKKKTRDKDDGCAIYYKASRFLLLEKLDIEFLQPHVPLLNRDNVALLVKLETRNVMKRQKIVVGTTHLLFNPKRLDVRLAQAQVLLAEIDRFAFCGIDRDGRNMYHPILMTGDFNCTPFSSVTKLFTDRRLQYLDENGDLIKLLKRTGFNSLLPPQCGITDQCQHYKIALERYKRWKNSHKNNFEIEMNLQHALVNLFPYMESRGIEFEHSDTCLLSPKEEDIESLLSPVTEGVEPVTSYVETADSKLLKQAAQKIAMQVGKTNNNLSQSLSATELYRSSARYEKSPENVDLKVVTEMKECGMDCDFGSGQLSHNLFLRDIHAPKLDRMVDGAPVSTKQQGWNCVDYIFQSMVYNSQLNKVIEGRLKLIRRLGLLSRSQCKQVGDIPNSDHPSDHFPLVAEFLLR